MSELEKPDFQSVFGRMQQWQETPDGRKHRLEIEAAQRRTARTEREQLCDAREVPTEPGVRNVALDPAPSDTQALAAVQAALQWRIAQPVPKGGRQPLVVVLVGRPGNGKTSAIAWAVANHSRPAQFVLARTVAATPRNGWNLEAWARWTSIDLLAIDELGREETGEKGDATARLSALISERYDAGRVTLCASNLDARGFETRYVDDRMLSRLHRGQWRSGGPGGCHYWYEIPDGDLRDPIFRELNLGGPR